MAVILAQTATGTSNLASTVVVFGNNTIAGNSIIVVIGCTSATAGDVSGITDTQGNIYTIVSATANAALGDLEVWYTSAIIGGANTITVTYTTGVSCAVIAREYWGLVYSGTLDKQITNTGNSNTLSSGTVAGLSQPIELLVGAGLMPLANVFSSGSGYSNLISLGAPLTVIVGMEDQFVTSNGAYAATFGSNGSIQWVCALATFYQLPHGTTTSTSSTSISSTSSSISSTSSSISSTSSSTSSTSTSLSTSSTSTSLSSTSSSISSTSSSTSSTSISSTSSSTSISSTSSSISSTSFSSTSMSSTSSSTSISSTSTSFSSTSSSFSSTSSSVSSTSFSSTSSSSSTSTTTLPPPYVNYSYQDETFPSPNFLNALSFNGVTSCVTLGSGIGATFSNAYSVEFWYQYPSQTLTNTLFANASSVSTNQLFRIECGNNGNIMVQLRNDANTTLINQLPSLKNYTNNVWHHCVWVDNLGTCMLYIDGIADTQNFNYVPASTLTLNTTALGTLDRLGGNIQFAQAFMSGLNTYNVALTQAQVTSRFNSQLIASSPTLTWNLNEGAGITATDSSGGGNNGTITSANYIGINLVNPFTAITYGNVSTDDGNYFVETGSKYMIREYKNIHTNNTDFITFTWKGRSTLSTLISPILIQIYNISTAQWETKASQTLVPADTDFQVSVTQSTNVSNYYDSKNVVTFRSYQLVV